MFGNAQILSSADRSLQAQAVGAHCLHTLSAFDCTVCVVTVSKLVAHNMSAILAHSIKGTAVQEPYQDVLL